MKIDRRSPSFLKIPDYVKLKIQFRLAMKGERLDLKNPKTFCQKIQWLSLYHRNPLYVQLADKYAVRDYVKNIIGDKYLVPLLGVWDAFEDIDFNALPEQFVLKCTHDSKSVVFCRDKKTFDIEQARQKIGRHLKMDKSRDQLFNPAEWHYGGIKPRVVAEKYLIGADGKEISDYKTFCFNGEPKYTGLYSDRWTGNRKDTFLDPKWNVMPFTIGHARHDTTPKKPDELEELMSVCKTLSQDIPFVRVDFYIVDGKLYFGELTFMPAAGYYKFNPPEWDTIIGGWLELPEKL